MSKKKQATDKTKIWFMLEKLNDMVQEDRKENSLYVPDKKFYFNDEEELVKVTDFSTGRTYTD